MKRQIIVSGVVGILALSMVGRAADVDFTLVRRDLLPENNAYALLTNALPQLQMSYRNELYETFRLAGNLTTNMPVGEARAGLDAWLSSKTEALALLSQGIGLGQLQLPVFGVEDYEKFAPIGYVDAARVKVVLARVDVERGQYEVAAGEFSDIFRMGQLIAAGDGPIIHYLVGVAVQSMGLNGMRWLAAHPDTPRAVLVQMLHELPVPDAPDPVLAQVYRVEFAQFTLPSIKMIEREALCPTNNFPIPIAHVLDVTNTVSTFESFYSRLVKNALSSWSDRDTEIEADAKRLVTILGIDDPIDFVSDLMLFSSVKQDRKATKKWKKLEKLARKQPNIFGKTLVMMMMPTRESLHARSVKGRTEVNLTRTLVALQCFQRDFGSWPESLSDPRFKLILPDDPIDFFTGKPVLYSKEKGLLWSVGPDGKDDGGDMKKDFVIQLLKQVAKITPRKLVEPDC